MPKLRLEYKKRKQTDKQTDKQKTIEKNGYGKKYLLKVN